MAIKASGQITLTSVVDVSAVYRYYLLQSSTAARPSAPKVFPPPSPWDDTEPTYTEGSTNSLYTVEATLFSDDSFLYSLVSLSSSYEAAKAAYNKATNALNRAVVQSATAPSITTVTWIDTSVTPALMKRYDAETAAWVVVNDTAEAVYNLEQNFEASLVKTQEDITATVAEKYYLKEDTDALISSVNTQIEQTKNSVEIQFNQFSQDVQAVAAGVDAEFEALHSYIRFEDGNIVQGGRDSPFKKIQSSTKESYYDSGTEVAYFSNRKLYVTDGEYTHSLRIGNLLVTPRANGNTSINIIK